MKPLLGTTVTVISVDCTPRHSCWDNRKSRQAFEKKLRCYEVSVVSGEVAPVFERDLYSYSSVHSSAGIQVIFHQQVIQFS